MGAMQLATFLALATGSTAMLPDHHPQHKAPVDLLHRIAKTNPAILNGDAPRESGGPTRKPFKSGLRVSPVPYGADPTGVEDSWSA